MPDRCLDSVGLLDVADRKVGGFSKGMRQRAKVASSLVTAPRILVLDEPLNGADPYSVALIGLFQALGAGPHRDRQLPRAQRGRAAGLTPDRGDPRASRPQATTTPSAARWPTAHAVSVRTPRPGRWRPG